MFCFNKLQKINVCKATQIRYMLTLQNLLEWAFNRCGCNFKVLVSSCIHSFICRDTQARYLKTGKRGSNLAHVKTGKEALHEPDWKRRTKATILYSFLWRRNFCLGKLSGLNIKTPCNSCTRLCKRFNWKGSEINHDHWINCDSLVHKKTMSLLHCQLKCTVNNRFRSYFTQHLKDVLFLLGF